MVRRSTAIAAAALQSLAFTLPADAFTVDLGHALMRPRGLSQAPVAGIRSARATRHVLAQQPPAGADGAAAEEKELTPESIAEMIEVSFLNSCLQLSQGYIDVLKLFIVAVKAGYERSMPLSELSRLVEDCPVNSAGRDLMAEEKALRLEWMKVVYDLLNALKDSDASSAVDSSCDGGSNDDRVSEVIRAMLAVRDELDDEEKSSGGKQDATVVLTNLTVDQALERTKLSESESMANPMDRAFLQNDVRVALMTFRVLEEERICLQDSAGRTTSGQGQPPRPSIPGT